MFYVIRIIMSPMLMIFITSLLFVTVVFPTLIWRANLEKETEKLSQYESTTIPNGYKIICYATKDNKDQNCQLKQVD